MCKTAIKAVILLAAQVEGTAKMGVKEIAAKLNSSEHTVSKILQSLVRQKIINSTKGPSGGFYIVAVQKQQPISAIVEAIDGKGVFEACGLGLNQCSAEHPCPIHEQYKPGRDIIHNLFKDNTINDLCQPVENGLAHLVDV